MSATDVLRRLLDERGVEYTANERDTQWWPKDNPAGVLAENSRYPHGTLDVYGLTPERAIAATLGDVPRLPHFWTHDGTLHVELPKLPESISVRLPAQRDREVGSARTWQYTLGNDGVGRTNDGLADLQAENAKLRELVDYMTPIALYAASERERDRMRELGIEVDR